MKKFIATAAFILAFSVVASAQNADHPYHVQGYFFGAAGATSPATLQVGGGGEGFVYKGLGVGGEVLYSARVSDISVREWIGSANVSYHFLPGPNNSKLDPFVTGGYTFFTRPNTGLGIANGGNIGAGINIWLKKHTALRLEVRDIVGGRNLSVDFEPASTTYLEPQNLVAFRIGATFR